MEIGLGAHIGMDAKIQKDQFSQVEFMVSFLITLAFIIMFIGIGIYTWRYYKQRKIEPVNSDQKAQRRSSINSQPGQVTKSSNRYLPSSKMRG